MMLARYTLAMLAAVLALFGVVAGTGTTARAEDETGAGGASYLPLYPAGDVYQLQVIGDWLAEGLKNGLAEAFRGDPRVAVRPRVAEFPALMRADFNDDARSLDDELSQDTPTVAVVMIGPQDRTSLRIGPRRAYIDSEEWREEFGRQTDVVMKGLKRRRLAVYWVSLPNLRRAEPNEDAQIINEIIREKAVLNGFRYIDAYAGFADEGGGYSAMGPDLTGKIRLLRDQGGIGFTEAGYRKLAHFVERELKRDLVQVKRDRAIPLAGTEAEQAAIATARQAQAAQAVRAAAAAAGQAAGQSQGAGVAAAVPALGAGPGDQKADTGRISLAVTGASGREEIVSVDLIRPAIPATVIDLVGKKEVADKVTTLGDLLIDKIPGGLIVMSSIAPAAGTGAGASRSRLPPTQTPYFRAIVKGERMPVRAERSDDVSWPRPEPPPVADAPAPPPVMGPPAPATSPNLIRKLPNARRAEGDPQAVRVR